MRLKILEIFILLSMCCLSSQAQRIFVFGDSHIYSGLGKYVGEKLKQKNSNVIYDYYGVCGASFTNNFQNNNGNKKLELIHRINKFKPDIIFCFIGTNEICLNQKQEVLYKYINDFLLDINVDHSKLILISMPYYDSICPQKIANIIKKYCQITHIEYIDIFNKNYSQEDQLIDKYHFTQIGYQKLAKYIIELYENEK
jgi:lysophospholipase L1-like esterase